MRYLPVVLIYFSCFAACQMEKTISLQEFGLPLEMSVPHNAKIMEMDLIVTRDIEIKTNGYYLQLLTLPIESDTTINTLENILHAVRSDSDFQSLIEENEHGFIYEKKDEAGISIFNFRHLIQLDSMVVMAKASDSMGFSLSEVRKMQKSVLEARVR